jgi:hypothetical protein
MLRAEKLSAELEYFNEYGRTPCPTVGAKLFEADPVTWRQPSANANRFGFCAGIFALPGAARSGWALRIARRALARYVEEHGRYGLPGYEQSMLNYSLRHLDMYDPEPVTSRTRICRIAEDLDEHAPKGFVHFWHAGQKRVPEMLKYLEKLTRRDTAHLPPETSSTAPVV